MECSFNYICSTLLNKYKPCPPMLLIFSKKIANVST